MLRKSTGCPSTAPRRLRCPSPGRSHTVVPSRASRASSRWLRPATPGDAEQHARAVRQGAGHPLAAAVVRGVEHAVAGPELRAGGGVESGDPVAVLQHDGAGDARRHGGSTGHRDGPLLVAVGAERGDAQGLGALVGRGEREDRAARVGVHVGSQRPARDGRGQRAVGREDAALLALVLVPAVGGGHEPGAGGRQVERRPVGRDPDARAARRQDRERRRGLDGAACREPDPGHAVLVRPRRPVAAFEAAEPQASGHLGAQLTGRGVLEAQGRVGPPALVQGVQGLVEVVLGRPDGLGLARPVDDGERPARGGRHDRGGAVDPGGVRVGDRRPDDALADDRARRVEDRDRARVGVAAEAHDDGDGPRELDRVGTGPALGVGPDEPSPDVVARGDVDGPRVRPVRGDHHPAGEDRLDPGAVADLPGLLQGVRQVGDGARQPADRLRPQPVGPCGEQRRPDGDARRGQQDGGGSGGHRDPPAGRQPPPSGDGAVAECGGGRGRAGRAGVGRGRAAGLGFAVLRHELERGHRLGAAGPRRHVRRVSPAEARPVVSRGRGWRGRRRPPRARRPTTATRGTRPAPAPRRSCRPLSRGRPTGGPGSRRSRRAAAGCRR